MSENSEKMENNNGKISKQVADSLNNDNLDNSKSTNNNNDITFLPKKIQADEFAKNETTLSITQPSQKKKYLFQSSIFIFLLVFCLSYISFSFVFNYYFIPIKVVGISMQPTINNSSYYENNDDVTHCDVVYYKQSKKYNNNDIVIISNLKENYVSADETDKTVNYLIKRVIATSGQTIKFQVSEIQTSTSLYNSYSTYIYTVSVLDENGNDINLDQSYLDENEKMYFILRSNLDDRNIDIKIIKNKFPFRGKMLESLANEGVFEEVVPENQYFVMGDNRNNSEDSRYFGYIAYDDIEGSVRILVAYNQTLFQAIIVKIKSHF